MSGEATPGTPPELTRAMARLGRYIRAARIRRGLTQRDLAGRMGVSRFSVIRLERGTPESSMGMYAGALEALDVLELPTGVADPAPSSISQRLQIATNGGRSLHDVVAWRTSGAASRQVGPANAPGRPSLWGRGRNVGFRDPRRRARVAATLPPFTSDLPAFAVRSSRVHYNGRKRRSCSPVRLYVISCRDSDPSQSAETADTERPLVLRVAFNRHTGIHETFRNA